MRFFIEIFGDEGSMYSHVSEHINRCDFDTVVWNFFDLNKQELSEFLVRNRYLTFTTIYDDAHTDTEVYYQKEFNRKFGIET